MIPIEEIRKRLRDRRISMVSQETGLHYNTIKSIRDGANTNPSLRVVKALSDYLAANS